jgi:thioredoxin reductase (NADPH)
VDTEHQPNFELFRIVAAADDSRVPQLRDVLRRFSLPFGFYPTDTRPDGGCSRRPGLKRMNSPY